MGVIIPEVTLPSQIKVSNVYASFSSENVLVFNNNNGSWRVASNYRLFSDQTKTNGSDIRIPIEVNTANISTGVYSILYQKIKDIYPDSIDIINNPVEPIINTQVAPEVKLRTGDETEFGSNVLARAEQYLLVHPDSPNLQNLYNIAELNFYANGLASTNEMMQILQLLDGDIPGTS